MWNWQQKSWANFEFEVFDIQKKEDKFLYNLGKFSGVFTLFSEEEKKNLILECITNESISTSLIEGEILERVSVQSSLRKNFGLQTDNRKILPKEFGISKMMYSLYTNANKKLSKKMLCDWHTALMNGRQDLENIGEYRKGKHPMQIVSGSIGNPKVHFEAPPSIKIEEEMQKFFDWYHSSTQSPLIKSAIAHIYFTSIHPFEDGNGRIGRAISEKILSEYFGKSLLISLAKVIEKHRKKYYYFLEVNNKDIEISSWIKFFTDIILEAQEYTQKQVEFIVKKAKFYQKNEPVLNIRQKK